MIKMKLNTFLKLPEDIQIKIEQAWWENDHFYECYYGTKDPNMDLVDTEVGEQVKHFIYYLKGDKKVCKSCVYNFGLLLTGTCVNKWYKKTV